MQWSPGPRSEDIEDRRSEGGGGRFSGGGMRLGLGGFLLLAVGSVVFKQNLFSLLGVTGDDPGAVTAPGPARPSSPEENHLVDFVSFVLDDVQTVWTKVLPTSTSTPYRHAKLVLFRDATRSGCGVGESATGPFYCPVDEKVYIDLAFYAELKQRFGAPGDFAQAYVIAHEIGHHVQKLLGTSDRVRRLQGAHPDERNALSVRLELQADCLAGVWGHSTQQRKIIDSADVEDALRAAAAIGDDRLQRGETGRVNPETWTHGSSEQRVTWFNKGLQSGRVDACDTFAAP